MEQETLPQSGYHRYQRGDVGGVARPHFAANRPAILVNDDAEDHLMQIRPEIFAMTVVADRLAAVTLEIQAGGIEDRQPDIVEQAAAPGEHLLLDPVLGGAGRQAAAGLIRQFLPSSGIPPASPAEPWPASLSHDIAR